MKVVKIDKICWNEVWKSDSLKLDLFLWWYDRIRMNQWWLGV